MAEGGKWCNHSKGLVWCKRHEGMESSHFVAGRAFGEGCCRCAVAICSTATVFGIVLPSGLGGAV